MAVMGNVSRPLIGVLVATVAFFAVWTVALRPSPPTSGAGSNGLGAYPSAIRNAQHAVAVANAASAAHGGAIVTSPRSTPPPAIATRPALGVRRGPAATRQRLDLVSRGLAAGRVLALLFYNPAAADDRAVRQELARIPPHGSRVVKLAVPLDELARYAAITSQVPVNQSPTLVLIDGDQQAATIVGFTDRFEIAQRVADALAVK